MKKLLLATWGVISIGILALSGCAPGYYYPPSHVEVVIVDDPYIPPCWDEPVYDPPPVVQAPPPRHEPIAKITSPEPKRKTPRSEPSRGSGLPRVKGGRGR